MCLRIQVEPLTDSRVEEVSSMDSNSNLFGRSRLMDSNLCSTLFLL